MSHNLVAFEWTCPLCEESKMSLVAQHEKTIEGLAKNAVAGHIRGSDDDVHSRGGNYPEDFDPTDVLQHIKFGEMDQARAVPKP